MKKIDFVITWVDGSDPEWLKDKEKHNPIKKKDESASKVRFRDWDNLKYWFRSIEKYADWVNKIYFVTYGHLPKWLNTKNEKLVIVNHKDYIPNELLPTFNSNTIEFYLHKINGLSENFVYFNDDMFITDYLKPEYFFKNDKPRDSFIMNATSATGVNSIINHTIINNLELLSRDFDKKSVIKKNFGKIFNLKYGKNLIRTLNLIPWKDFTGMYNHHVAISYMKSSFEEVWNKYGDDLYVTTKNKFRTKYDFNHWLVRYWQLFNGNFIVKSNKKDKYFDLSNDTSEVVNAIRKRKYKMICINDSNPNLDFDKVKNEINLAFDYVLSEKSQFEF